MKKSLFIWGLAAVLVIVAILVTKGFGNNIAAVPSPTQALATPVEKPSKAKGDNSIGNVTTVKATDFTLTDIDGKKISLSEYKGKYVYLNFFATWCPPCRAEMPDIEKMYQKYWDKGFVVLAVNLGEDQATVKDFIQQNKYSFRVLLDSDQSVAAQYNISAIPVSYFINKDGNVVAKRVGELSEEEMRTYINQLFGE